MLYAEPLYHSNTQEHQQESRLNNGASPNTVTFGLVFTVTHCDWNIWICQTCVQQIGNPQSHFQLLTCLKAKGHLPKYCRQEVQL